MVVVRGDLVAPPEIGIQRHLTARPSDVGDLPHIVTDKLHVAQLKHERRINVDAHRRQAGSEVVIIPVVHTDLVGHAILRLIQVLVLWTGTVSIIKIETRIVILRRIQRTPVRVWIEPEAIEGLVKPTVGCAVSIDIFTGREGMQEVEVKVKGGPQTPMMSSPRASVRVTSKTTSLSMYCAASAEPRLTRALAPTTVELKVWPETLRMWRMLEDIAREARMRILAG